MGQDLQRRTSTLTSDDADAAPTERGLHASLTGPTGRAARAQAAEMRAVQWMGDGRVGADAHAVAQQGVAGAGGPLPHRAPIQATFGRHDVSDVQAHIGGPAQSAAQAMNARAYATGRDVAFARPPDLHTAAHEAAHVVQQRGGVQLDGGVGHAGDPYERHADAVADAVVAGRSAEGLLDRHAGGGGASGAVQYKPEPGEGAAQDTAKGPAAPASTDAKGASPADDKTTFVVRWSGKFGGDLSAKVIIAPVGRKADAVTKAITDPDGGKGGRSQVLEAKLPVKAARRMRIEVIPTAAAPEDRYRRTAKTVKVADLTARESRHEIELAITRTNEKNVVDVWEQRGIDPKKARHVYSQTLLGHRVQLNHAVKPTVDKTNAALGKLGAAEQAAVKASIIRIGGYNRRTTSKGTFSNHSIGCAIDVNYNGDTKQNHHFHKSEAADRQLLAFVQKVVRSDKALATFDIWASTGQSQLQASKAFERLFPAYLRGLLGDKAPLVEAPPKPASPPSKPAEGGKAEATDSPAPVAQVLDLASVSPAVLGQAIKAAPDKDKKAELRFIAANLPALKAWVLGAQVEGRKMVGMVPIHEKLLQVMLGGGWGWGGDWSSAKDYMHFEDRGAMDGLKKESGGAAKE